MVVRTCTAWERLVTSTEDIGHRGLGDREVSEWTGHGGTYTYGISVGEALLQADMTEDMGTVR